MNEITENEVSVTDNDIASLEATIGRQEILLRKKSLIIEKQATTITRLESQLEKYKSLLKDAFENDKFDVFMCNLFDDSKHNKWTDFCVERCPYNESDIHCQNCYLLECNEEEPNCDACPSSDTCEDPRSIGKTREWEEMGR